MPEATCTVCNLRFFTASGKDVCVDCRKPQDQKGPAAGAGAANATCTKCKQTFFSASGKSTVCLVCRAVPPPPDGKPPPPTGPQNNATCGTCGIGFFSASGKSTCPPCRTKPPTKPLPSKPTGAVGSSKPTAQSRWKKATRAIRNVNRAVRPNEPGWSLGIHLHPSPSGPIVHSLVPGGSAEVSRVIQVGDIIVAIGTTEVTTVAQAAALLNAKKGVGAASVVPLITIPVGSDPKSSKSRRTVTVTRLSPHEGEKPVAHDGPTRTASQPDCEENDCAKDHIHNNVIGKFTIKRRPSRHEPQADPLAMLPPVPDGGYGGDHDDGGIGRTRSGSVGKGSFSSVKMAMFQTVKGLRDVRDPKGSEKLQAIATSCRRKMEKFSDPEFPATETSLSKHSSVAKRMASNRTIVWKRAAELGCVDRSGRAVVFGDSISVNSVKQGALGDCYFLAAASVCAAHPALVQNLVDESSSDVGIYGVKFSVRGRWITVVVDDQFPCYNNGREFVPLFAKWGDHKEIWAMLLEKAFAKLQGTYGAIESGQCGDALSYLTGGLNETVSFRDSDFDEDRSNGLLKLWQQLVGLSKLNTKDVGCFMSAGSVDPAIIGAGGPGGMDNPDGSDDGEGGSGLVTDHAYSVLECREVGGKHRLVHVRNPWGKFEWQGDWGDDSPLWTKEYKKQVNFVAADDGAFWMALEDFTSVFTSVHACTMLPKEWKKATLHGQWASGSTAAGNSDAFIDYNPRFVMKSAGGPCALSMEVLSSRFTGLVQPQHSFNVYSLDKDDKGEDTSATIAKSASALASATLDNMMSTFQSSWTRGRVASHSMELPKGTFLIVPMTRYSGVCTDFWISVASPQGHFKIEPVTAPSRSAEHAAKMASVPIPATDVCVACNTKAVEGEHDVNELAELIWHSKCYKCLKCDKKLATVKEAQTGLDSIKKAWGGFCPGCWDATFLEKCLVCSKPVKGRFYREDTGRTHTGECHAKYTQSKADRCLQCNEPVCKIEGKFEGRFYTIENAAKNGKVHSECYTTYQQATSDKCGHCSQPVCKIEGKFNGRFYTVANDVKVHSECYEKYQTARAERCIECSGPVMKIEGKYSGSYYTIKEDAPKGPGPCHSECHQQYVEATSDRCTHCSKPICKIPGVFGGRFYTIGDKANGVFIHSECYDEYKQKK